MTDTTPTPATTTTTKTRRALVTGASGYVGGLLVPKLLEDGWTVRVLTRDADHLDSPWVDDVEVAEGDATSADDLREALADVTAAYFLIHSMEGGGGFADEDRDVAKTFAAEAKQAGVRRIVYLSGLHPDGELSEHLASRVEVGDILLDSGVPTAVLQAAVVLGHGSASFEMLRYLTTRLPAMVAPKWLENRIQPIAIDDVLHYLVAAASLPDDVNRTFDIGGPDVLTYAEMMQEFASVTGLRKRVVQTVPVMTPELASLWVGLVTPVNAKVARPLVGSLVHEVVVQERDLDDLVGAPPGGHTPYREGVAKAMRGVPKDRAFPIWAATVGAVTATAAAGTAVTDPTSAWYRSLDLPAWQPPKLAFPIAWTALYADIALTCGSTLVKLDQRAAEGDREAARRRDGLARALAVNLVLNFGWSALFFGAKKPAVSAVEAALLAASSTDLVRRVAAADGRAGAALSPYAAWTTFATALSTEIWRRNRR
ncbi:tryptophan-rich sensory protein [Mariniluteicoccus flavus]